VHAQQLAITVTSSDSIDSIMAKVNALTAQHGVAMSFNGGTNRMELTSTARTDANHDLQLAGGTDYLRLSFANDYRSPAIATDKPPEGYNGFGDNFNLYAKLQMNTLFTGSGAGDIAIDSRIKSATDIHAGYNLAASDNGLALGIHNLQHSRLADGGQFTIAEQYANFIAGIGTDVNRADVLSENEAIQLEGFLAERDTISGVNIDEELAQMIQFQRAYEANARMFSTFDQLVEELLSMVR
jgi:flagellar hook-associated protein FlgK